MNFHPTQIPDIVIVEPQVFTDSRGFFMETYQAKVFSNAGISAQFVQDNHSGSVLGILRGLHYQIHQAQGKLVRAVAGKIYDVAVDIRRSSPTCGKYVGVELSAENKLQLWIPAGFAHGFYVLSDWAEVTYKATDYYAPQWERSILWNDPDLGIEWPLVQGQLPILSAKDQRGVPFSKAELFE